MPSRPVRRRGLALAAAALVVMAGPIAAVRSGGPSAARPDPEGPARGQFAVSRTIGAHGAARRGIATSCRVLPATSPRTRLRPLLVVAGASFTAGEGAPAPADGWAVRLAELIRWRAVTLGVPGTGYTRPGAGHSRSPVAAAR